MGTMWADPKFVELKKYPPRVEDAAVHLWVKAISWSNCYETDGHLPARVVHELSRSRARLEATLSLVCVGLWHETCDGFLIHDFDDYNVTTGKQAKRRENSRKSSAKHRAKQDDGDTPVTGHESVSDTPVTLLEVEVEQEEPLAQRETSGESEVLEQDLDARSPGLFGGFYHADRLSLFTLEKWGVELPAHHAELIDAFAPFAAEEISRAIGTSEVAGKPEANASALVTELVRRRQRSNRGGSSRSLGELLPNIKPKEVSNG